MKVICIDDQEIIIAGIRHCNHKDPVIKGNKYIVSDTGIDQGNGEPLFMLVGFIYPKLQRRFTQITIDERELLQQRQTELI